MTKTTQYLYGINPSELENKFYKEALQYKLESGRHLHMKLYNETKAYGDETHRRLFYVQKAIQHTSMLLEEITNES